MRGLIGFLVLAGCVSCASSGPHAPPVTHTPDPSIPKCAGDATLGCLTAPSCQYDAANNCQQCICSPAMQTVPQPFSPP